MSAPSLSRPERLVLVLLTIQVAIPFAVLFLRPGFDKKNSAGLDFNFVLLMIAVAGFSWLAGLVFSLHLEARKGAYVAGHVASLLLAATIFFLV
jgi:hypothetical protein